MKLTREQAISEHRKMWNWIADMTEKLKRRVEKEEYFRGIGFLDIPYMKCYCCEFERYNPNCCDEHCIIDWGEGIGCADSYYKKWIFTDYWQEAALFAKIIADLPERDIDEN